MVLDGNKIEYKQLGQLCNSFWSAAFLRHPLIIISDILCLPLQGKFVCDIKCHTTSFFAIKNITYMYLQHHVY